MAHPSLLVPSEIEQSIAALLESTGTTRDAALRLIKSVPANQQFVMNDFWRKLASDGSAEGWRRLAAYELLIDRCLAFPYTRAAFAAEALTPLGVDEGRSVEMTKAQFVPVQRKTGEIVRMAVLPIATSVGPAAIYYTLHRASGIVRQAAVYPNSSMDETA